MKRFLFLPLLMLPIAAFAEGGLPDKPYIYVQGLAELEKFADIAKLRFDLVSRAADQVKANQQLQGNAAKVFGILNSEKIAEADVVAQDLKSEPEFEEGPNGRTTRKILNYKVSRPFEVKIRDVTIYAKLLEELIPVGGIEFSETETDLSNRKDMEDQLRDKALANARDRAEKTLKGMAMKIDSVFLVSPVSPTAIENEIFGGIERLGVRSSEASYRRASNTPEYRLAPVKLSQSVHIIYLISPAK